jgi:hypothetical protein
VLDEVVQDAELAWRQEDALVIARSGVPPQALVHRIEPEGKELLISR